MLTVNELAGLPPQLIKELGINKSRRIDIAIYSYIKTQGTASISQILLHIYKELDLILGRANLTGRLYRMRKRGDIFVTTKKGVYTTQRPEQLCE